MIEASRSEQRDPELLTEEQRRLSEEFLAEGSKPMRIALLFNAEKVEDTGIGAYNTELIGNELSALRALGHEVIPVGLSFDNLAVLDQLESDFVFNGCEGTGLDGDPGVEVVLALERRLLPFSGAGSAPYQISNDKWLMKLALQRAGVPVPSGFPLHRPDLHLAAHLSYPLFVKPRYGFGSLTINADSKVSSTRAARTAVERVLAETGIDALVEEYIEGRELTVAILGCGRRTLVLPPLEVRFDRAYDGQPAVRMRATKTDRTSPLYWGFHTECPASLTPAERRIVEETALKAYRAVQADGFGRVDIRLSRDGTPYVLEVNTNCSLEYGVDEHDAGMFPLVARAIGWSYQSMLARIIGAGRLRPLKRYRKPLITLRAGSGRITPRATMPLRRGAAVLRFGAASAQESQKTCAVQHIESYLRAAEHSETPSLGLELRGSDWCLVTTRALKTGEIFTVNQDQLLVALLPPPQEKREEQPRQRKRRPRLAPGA